MQRISSLCVNKCSTFIEPLNKYILSTHTVSGHKLSWSLVEEEEHMSKVLRNRGAWALECPLSGKSEKVQFQVLSLFQPCLYLAKHAGQLPHLSVKRLVHVPTISCFLPSMVDVADGILKDSSKFEAEKFLKNNMQELSLVLKRKKVTL